MLNIRIRRDPTRRSGRLIRRVAASVVRIVRAHAAYTATAPPHPSAPPGMFLEGTENSTKGRPSHALKHVSAPAPASASSRIGRVESSAYALAHQHIRRIAIASTRAGAGAGADSPIRHSQKSTRIRFSIARIRVRFSRCQFVIANTRRIVASDAVLAYRLVSSGVGSFVASDHRRVRTMVAFGAFED